MIITQEHSTFSLNELPSDRDSIAKYLTFLERQGTFYFPVLPTGLFSAAELGEDASYTGYDNVWVRDNIYIAFHYHVIGNIPLSFGCVDGLRRYFIKHRHRFESIINGISDPDEPMNRPHIRFNGATLEENVEKWSHAQNDALGYFLWLYCKLVVTRQIPIDQFSWDLASLFVHYFKSVRYWEDSDSGHWEESRKVQASSIGVVVAALQELRTLMLDRKLKAVISAKSSLSLSLIDELLENGKRSLNLILPYECSDIDNAKVREYDAALLFLIFPLDIVDDSMADRIINNIEENLVGDHGIRRYLRDSFWCANYKELCKPTLRTADVSDDMSLRDSLVKSGQEAQWCIFDPILATIYSIRYQKDNHKANLEKAMHYLHRSLNQLTKPNSRFPEYRCPELYYLDGNKYVPNDVTPLLWTQANLRIALHHMLRNEDPSS